MKISRFTLMMLGIALFPVTVSANAGTPLMWATMLHLVFGNAFIGVLEGLILSLAFNLRKGHEILVLIFTLILANYVSAWVGGSFVVNRLSLIPDITISNIRFWFGVFATLAFVITLLIELPFVWFVIRQKRGTLRRVLGAALLVNCLSYTLLFGWYWNASGTSMMTRLQAVPSSELSLDEHYTLYFLSSDGDRLLKIDLADMGVPENVVEVSAPHENDRLFVRAREDSNFDLFVFLHSDERGSEKEILLIESFAMRAASDPDHDSSGVESVDGTAMNFGRVPSLAGHINRVYSTGYWAVEGIRWEDEKLKGRQRYSLETPIAAWAVRNATHLPGDSLVFQLGKDQICIMHPDFKKIALIARGKGPIVAKVENFQKRDSVAVDGLSR